MTVPPIFVWSVFVLLVLMATAPLWRLAVFGFNPCFGRFPRLYLFFEPLRPRARTVTFHRPLAARRSVR